MNLYPVNLKIAGRRCTIVGGGQVALRKAEALLRCGALVRVVAPALDEGFEAFHGRFEHIARPYRWGDLEGSMLAIAATDDEETNQAVEEEAHGRHLLLNVVDQPERCSFYVPSSVRRGELLLTVATGGQLPALSKRLRQELEGQFGTEWEPVLNLLGKARQRVIATINDPEQKQRCLAALAALDLVSEYRRGGDVAVQAEIDRCISQF